MGVKAQTPASTIRNLVLGAGAIYADYGEVTEAVIGATRGGSTFTVEREIREIEQDGTYGAVKSHRQKTRVQPILMVNAMELNTTNIPKFFGGMTVTTSNPSYDVITEDIALADTDYLTNIAFVGETKDGEDVVIIVKNALGDGNIEFAIEDKNEIVPEVQFTGHYATDALTTPPYEIRFPKSAGDTTPPTISSSLPTANATGVSISADYVLTFSEAIRSDTITSDNIFMLKTSDNTPIAGTLSWNSAQTVITFNPTSNLTANTQYSVFITTGIKDIAGNSIASTSVRYFTTAP
jgi:hypothetical protein